MNYYTTDIYETKREIVNFSNHITQGLPKAKSKFVMDMLYGISASQSMLISDISRNLQEPVKLISTIERLCDHAASFGEEARQRILMNYYQQIRSCIPEEPVILLDDSDINKDTAYKLEDLCRIKDGSQSGIKIVKGYHVCEAVVISKEEQQPIPLYSHIYSTESEGFVSKNQETLKSIDTVRSIVAKKATYVCDRGYDAQIYYRKFLETGDTFLIRANAKRNVKVKGKTKSIGELASKRKGKVKMDLYFRKEDKEVYVSYTRVELPSIPGVTFTLVLVYGLSDTEPMMLLTNQKVKGKKEAHQVVRTYMNRWRIEENFRCKKQVYGYENMRVRSLEARNTLGTLLMIHIGHIGKLAEKVNRKLLVIKMIERGKSLRKEVRMWYYQIARGIKEILKYARSGIREYQDIERRREKEVTLFPFL